jgi:hypothetical protein
MPTERQSPDALLVQTGLVGAVTAIQDDPDSPDANWLTASPTNNNATVCSVSFPTPSGTLTAGAGLQEFRVWLRKTNHSTNPTAVVQFFCLMHHRPSSSRRKHLFGNLYHPVSTPITVPLPRLVQNLGTLTSTD